jgi:YVTN family beta-propeller protein
MKVIFYITILLLLLSCSKEEVGPQCVNCEDEITETKFADVLITNEGTFNWNNGSISLYKPSTQSISQNIFSQANNNLPIGDVVQSITQINNKAYIAVNNSNKVEVVDLNSFNSLATITGFTSPRYFLPIDNNKAYVTDLYSNSIQIVNLNSNSISGNIPTSGWTEELLLFNDSVYVCDMTNDNLLILDPSNNTLVDSIKVGESPNSIVIDQNDKIWILCSGGINSSTPKLIKFNPQTRSIESTFSFTNISESPSSLEINNDRNQLYYLNANVYKMSINNISLPSSPIISSNNNTYYGLGIDPINEDIYVSDAIDYVQNGIVFRYSSTGALIHQFNSGIIPGSFLFIK